MEADILAFAQQVCSDAYVERQVSSACASLWGNQLAAAISGALAVAAFVAFVVFYVLDRRGLETYRAWGTSALISGLAALVALYALAAAGIDYQNLIAWQNDPVTQVAKSVAEAI